MADVPEVKEGRLNVTIVSPRGMSVTLVERSKMHYIDKPTFFNILRDAWNRCKASDGMNYEQLEKTLSAKNVPHVASAVEVERPSSIRFLDMNMSRKGYMKRIVDLQRIIETMTWPSQNNRPGIAGASRGLFLGAQTNRGYQQGCVSKKTFDAKYVQVLQKVHALAKCCQKTIPYMGIYLTRLETGQGLSQHRDFRNHEKYINYTINFGHYTGGHLEMLRNEEWESCAAPLIWVEFTADIIQHRVREVTSGIRYSVTLFTPNHLERLSPVDWMNLESFGFPVDLYPERDAATVSAAKGPINSALETVASTMSAETEESPGELKVEDQEGPEAHAVEKKAKAQLDPLDSLSGQVPQPSTSEKGPSRLSLEACALKTRDFNAAMGLPKGELPKCIDKARSSVYGRMLREEVQEVENALERDRLHEVLAESIDVLYLTFNLLQECGLERAIEPAFMMKHEDNMKKQHETVAHLAWTRNAYTRSKGKTEAEMAFTVSRTEGGRWLLYSQGKLIKPYDYVPGDYEVIVKMLADEDSVKGPENAQVAHSSGPHTSQYTFCERGCPGGSHFNRFLTTSLGWLSTSSWLATCLDDILHVVGQCDR